MLLKKNLKQHIKIVLLKQLEKRANGMSSSSVNTSKYINIYIFSVEYIH